jgi:hypothetical protein
VQELIQQNAILQSQLLSRNDELQAERIVFKDAMAKAEENCKLRED